LSPITKGEGLTAQPEDDRLWFTAQAGGLRCLVPVTDLDIGANRNAKGRVTVDGKAAGRISAIRPGRLQSQGGEFIRTEK
jgi:hypothetical protein